MNYLRVLWTYLRLGALNELQYRANFFVQLLQSAFGLATALGGLALVFAHARTLAGWRPEELLVVVGVFLLAGGVVNLVVQPSMQRLMEDVRLGTLDYVLTKPEDAQLLVSLRQVQIWKLVDVALGLVVLAVAVARLGASLGPWQALGTAVALLAGAVMVYAFLLLLATSTFWFVRVDNILVIYQSLFEAGRWPVGIYPPWLKGTLTFLVPVGFAITVPSEALVGRLSPGALLGAVVLAAALLVASRLLWRVGLRRYTGASA